MSLDGLHTLTQHQISCSEETVYWSKNDSEDSETMAEKYTTVDRGYLYCAELVVAISTEVYLYNGGSY